MANQPDSEGGGFKLVSAPGPSDTPPATPGAKGPGGTRPPFPKAPAPPPPPARVQVGTDDTPVAILGFSGSGKTVYLTMLYYATGVTHAFPEEWESDFLVLDQSGKTDSYLKEAYKLILGIGPDGRLVFKDPLGQRVERKFPKGTDEQEMLTFMLTRSTGVRDFKLNVKTLDVKGEALRRFAANIATPKPEDLARDPTLRIDYQRWQQMRDLCEQAGAILLFFNLLNWEDYDHVADVNTLVGLLLNQKKPPMAFAFVVTGIDVLQGENEVVRKREEIIENFKVAIRRLEKRGVAWDVLMISNFGRGFTRKIETLPANHPCSGKRADHVCNRCQELVPDVNAKPAPVDLDKPWEFVYSAIKRKKVRRLIQIAAAVFIVGFLPLAIFGWGMLSGWRQNQQLIALVGENGEKLTVASLPAAIALEREVDSNRVYRVLSSTPPPVVAQLRELAEAHAIYSDPKRPWEVRLAEAARVKGKLSEKLAALVPLEEMRIDAEFDAINSGPDMLVRIEAANKALGDPNRSPAARKRMIEGVEKLLASLLAQLRERHDKLKQNMDGEHPAVANESAYIDYIRALQGAIERGEVKNIKGAADIRNELPQMIVRFTTFVDYVRVVSLPDKTVENLNAKLAAVRAFQKSHPAEMQFAAGVLEEETLNLSLGKSQEEAFNKLPNYDPNTVFTGTRDGGRNFAQFAKIAKDFSDFVLEHKSGRYVDEIKGQLNRMKAHAADMVSMIGSTVERERLGMKAQEIRHTMAEWDTDVARTESDIKALQDLAKIFPELPVATVQPNLEELLVWKKAALDVARVIATVPANDKQVDDQRRELAALALRLKADVPARQQAQIEAGRLEDTLLANEMDAELNRLQPPERATVESPVPAFQSAIKGHNDFLAKFDQRLATPDRRTRFQRFLADTQRRDPLKTSADYRDRFMAKLAEKELWEKIEAAQNRRNVAERAELLRNAQSYLDLYPAGEKVSAVRSVRQFVEAWRVEKVSYRVDIFVTSAATTALKITVWPVNRTPQTRPLDSRTFPVANRQIVSTAAAGVSFDWNSAQDLELEVVVTGTGGQELFKETRAVSAANFTSDMSQLIQRGPISIKLAPQS